MHDAPVTTEPQIAVSPELAAPEAVHPDVALDSAEPKSTELDVAPPLEIRVWLFASLKDAIGDDYLVVEAAGVAPDDTISVDALLSLCAVQYPQLALWLPHIKVAVNCEYSGREQLVSRHDEVAFLPPVSGGCRAAGCPINSL